MNNLSHNEFKNVVDFNAAKIVKARTGQAKAVRLNSPETPDFEKHANEAMAQGNPVKPKMSLTEKVGRKLGIWE